jgi:outer membrane assembly lipoprotein YfiO
MIPFISCTHGVKGIKLTEDEIFKIANKQVKEDFKTSLRGFFREDKFTRTAKLLEQMIEEYPEGKFSREALIEIADLHYIKGKENIVDAEVEYENFLKRYPTSEEATRAQYRLGMSVFRQLTNEKPDIESLDAFDKLDLTIKDCKHYRDKDITLLDKASQSFASLVINYPDSEYSEVALEYLSLISHIYSMHDLYVANFYLIQKNYIAAYNRLENVLIYYPDSVDINEVKYLTNICLFNLKYKKESLANLQKLDESNIDGRLKKKVNRTIKKFSKK